MACLCWASVSTQQGNIQVGLEIVAGELVFIVDLLAGEVIHPKFYSWVVSFNGKGIKANKVVRESTKLDGMKCEHTE